MENEVNASNVSVYVRPFDDVAVAVTSSILLPLCAFGLAANLTTIVVIAKSHKLRTVFNCMIMSLCVSDLFSAAISPLFLYRRTWGFDEWNASNFLCKLIWGVDIWTSYVTSIHILLFAVVRFLSVKSPELYYKIKRIHIKVSIAFIWLTTFVIGFVPFFIFFGSKTRDRSANTVDAKWPSCSLNVEWVSAFRLYTNIVYSFLFYLPMLALACLSIAIAWVLYEKRRKRQLMIGRGVNAPKVTLELKRRRKEKQIMLQLGLIVGSFLVGYFPQTVYHFYTTGVKPTTQCAKELDWAIGIGTYICLRVSECLNPVFYNLASRKMRKETAAIVFSCCAPGSSKPQLSLTQTTPRSGAPNASQSRDALEM